MNLNPRIETSPEKKLIGLRFSMNFARNTTGELWKNFMPRRKEILHPVSPFPFSMQVYPEGFFRNFNPLTEFEKWAAMEVNSFEAVPEGMETFLLPGGLYAVFPYKGAASAAGSFFQKIHAEWLPASEYELDLRPHFEILGEKYKNENPDSEEDVWIPVKRKF